jgi:DNA-binding transcriptional LysR family regulator
MRTGPDMCCASILLSLKNRVESGFGVAVLPSFVALACRRYKVQMSILVEPVVPLSFYQITKKGRITANGTAALASALKSVFQERGAGERAKPGLRP